MVRRDLEERTLLLQPSAAAGGLRIHRVEALHAKRAQLRQLDAAKRKLAKFGMLSSDVVQCRPGGDPRLEEVLKLLTRGRMLCRRVAVEVSLDEQTKVFAGGGIRPRVVDGIAHWGELRGLLLLVAFAEGNG